MKYYWLPYLSGGGTPQVEALALEGEGRRHGRMETSFEKERWL